MNKIPLALVTGAAHRLGKSIAIKLAHLGFAIILHYYDAAEDAANTANEITSLGVPVFTVQADLSKDTGLTKLFSFLDSIIAKPEFKLRALINSAGLFVKTDPFSISPDIWDSTFAINLRAPFLLSQKVASCMDQHGVIINISDAGARKLWTGYSEYVVSKSALETLTKLLAKAFAPNIRVNAIAPGLVIPEDNLPREEWDGLVERLPLKHPTSSEEICNAVEFLLSNESITGQILGIDGGFSLD